MTDCIIRQGSLGCYGFVLEMVEGIAQNSHQPRGDGEPCCNDYEKWLCELQRRAPMFRVHTWLLQASEYLPQNRGRLYTVGIHRDFAPSCGLLPPSTSGNVWRAALPDLLNMGLRSIDEGVLSPQQQQNLKVATQCVALQPNVDGGCVSCISVDRDPHLQFGHFTRNDGRVGTLRTQNDLVWLQVGLRF